MKNWRKKPFSIFRFCAQLKNGRNYCEGGQISFWFFRYLKASNSVSGTPYIRVVLQVHKTHEDWMVKIP